jgi:hypothetical protein
MAAYKKYISLDSYEKCYIYNGLSHLTHKTQLIYVCACGGRRLGENVDLVFCTCRECSCSRCLTGTDLFSKFDEGHLFLHS